MVNAGHVGGTRGSCILSSAADVIWMSVVRGMGGVGEGLGLGFTNPVLYVCLGCGGVGREWIGASDQGLEGWGGFMSV